MTAIVRKKSAAERRKRPRLSKRRGKYHWDEWLTSFDEIVLYKGLDYFCSQSTMVNMARIEASRRRLSICIDDTDFSLRITVRGTLSA